MVKPYGLNIIRVGLSILLFWIVWLAGKTPAGIQKKHIGRFLLCGLLGVAINQMMFLKGLTLTSTIHASLLILFTPIVITLFAFLVLKERITTGKLAGLILGISGSVLLILSKETPGAGQSSLTGDMLIMLNAISYAIYFILVKPLMAVYPPLHVVRWVFTIGLFMILPFGWEQFLEVEWQQLDYTHILAILSVVVLGTFLAYYFNVYGIRHLGAGITGAYIYTQPIFASIIAIAYLNEVITPEKIIAGLMIFTGVFLVSNINLKRPSSSYKKDIIKPL